VVESTYIRGVLYIPAGAYKITQTLTIPASLGVTVQGEGAWCTRLQFDPATPNADGLVINSSQFVTLRDFALWGLKANPVGKMLNYDYNPVVIGATQLRMHNLWIGSNDANEAMDVGIYFSDAYGNNSEVQAYSVVVERFMTAGIQMPGSQQKAMNFFGCSVNGAWDASTGTGGAGGLWGVYTGGGPSTFGGSFQWWGGGVGACKGVAFNISYPNDPFIIHGVQSEHCYRFLAAGSSPSSSRSIISIAQCRLDCGSPNVFDSTGYVQWAGTGTLIFDGNTVTAGNGSGGNPKIRLSGGGQFRSVQITNNQFLTIGSVDESPLIYNVGFVDVTGTVVLSGNTYTKSDGNVGFRNEVLDQPVQNTVLFNWQKTATDLWGIDYTKFTANSASQTVELQSTLPKGMHLKHLMAALYNYFVHTGSATVFMKVGVTSGGDEILQEFVVSTPEDNGIVFGKPGSMECGTAWNPGGYFMDWNATSKLYVTVRVSTGTVGNGTTSNLTRGVVHFPTHYEVTPRFIA
jgi:hypothetical protein